MVRRVTGRPVVLLGVALIALTLYGLGIVVDADSAAPRILDFVNHGDCQLTYSNIRIRSVALDTQFLQVLHERQEITRFALDSRGLAQIGGESRHTVVADRWS